MRLFVALPLPAVLRNRLAGLRATPADGFPPARWIPEERLHLTVDFLGELERSAVAPLADAIDRAVGLHTPFQCVTGSPGAFPPRGTARVLWVGLDASEALQALQRSVAGAVDMALGRTPAARQWTPHLTVARCRPPWPSEVVFRWCERSATCRGMEFGIAYLDLMRSRLTPSGPRYRRLARFPLGD